MYVSKIVKFFHNRNKPVPKYDISHYHASSVCKNIIDDEYRKVRAITSANLDYTIRMIDREFGNHVVLGDNGLRDDFLTLENLNKIKERIEDAYELTKLLKNGTCKESKVMDSYRKKLDREIINNMRLTVGQQDILKSMLDKKY